jgi:cyclohexanone monooxygenase
MTHSRVLVLGAGASGIATAIALRVAGIDDFLVLEQADDVGGTWRENTYPGCACDVPSHWYSYSFDPNPFWSRFYPRQDELRRYFRASARRHGVFDNIRFGVSVHEARWDPAAQRWVLRTSDGEYTATVLAAAPGPLHVPQLPPLPGLDQFSGTMFHSARWDHSYDLTGKRVAVIGTGASAIQFVPEIAPKVAELHVFQRTPSWVLAKVDFPIPEPLRYLFHTVPATQRAVRLGIYAVHEAAGVAFRHDALMRRLSGAARLQLRAQVRDPALRARLTPEFTLGCKRVMLSNNYYPALTRPNVTVHAAAAALDATSVLDRDGAAAEVDAVIFGTGFETADPPLARYVFDGQGRSLAQRWASEPPRMYLGTTTPGFPNLFTLVGPNTAPGHASVLGTIERQARYVADAVGALSRGGWSSLEVHPTVFERFNTKVQRALGPTVYNSGGCRSYYLHSSGHNVANWPWSLARLHREVRFNDKDYVMTKASEAH